MSSSGPRATRTSTALFVASINFTVPKDSISLELKVKQCVSFAGMMAGNRLPRSRGVVFAHVTSASEARREDPCAAAARKMQNQRADSAFLRNSTRDWHRVVIAQKCVGRHE